MSHGEHSKRQKTEAELEAEKKRREAEYAKAEEARCKEADKAMEAASVLMSAAGKEASASKISLHSNHSGKSSKKGGSSKFLEALAGAKPEGIKIDAPAKALVEGNTMDCDIEDEFEEHAFDHPSTYMQQRMIWIPKWEAHPELSAELVKEIEGRGVAASDMGAMIDEIGYVNVSRGPPDEDWSGGNDK